MTQQPSITVPLALSCTRSAWITLPWFVQKAEHSYRPMAATYEPLVNGDAAFGALYDAIDQATRSIDYVAGVSSRQCISNAMAANRFVSAIF
ncbi:MULTISPECIES: hypothetical protein [unclassified Caballeronia]|uniref:hypothetical protein n=1 Tax=unclassified Caballeronia TaxID=2646786 RepID=UPI0028665F3C|nr:MULTISPECIES: hypothetical protein [unclassified Caballeronia]MDR5751416.1 hypothetical protein [Caballeronia sp. LZ024]